MFTLNDDQLRAVNIDHNCVVIAGAGAGKTTVLASRVLRLMVQKQVPLHKILLLTFTKKATAEITERVYSLLDECIQHTQYLDTPLDDAQVQFLYAQQENVQRAQIFTIDAFSFRIAQIGINRLGYLGTLEVSQSLMGDIQIFVEKWLMSHPTHVLKDMLVYMPFNSLVEQIIYPLLEKVSCFSYNLDTHLTRIIEEVNKKLLVVRSEALQATESLYAILPKDIKGSVDNLVRVLKDMHAFFKDDATRYTCPQFKINMRGVTNTKAVKSNAHIVRAKKELLCNRIAMVCCCTDTLAHEAYYRGIYNALQEIVDDWNEYRHSRKLYSYRNIAEIAQHTLKEFDDVREWYSARYDHIIVDEFQDNNLDQKMLLYLLSGVPADRIGIDPLPHKYFFVGDPKQSIYSFRGADIHSFLSLKQDNQQLYMSKNFRSNAQLIDMYNAWFQQFFDDETLNAHVTISDALSPTPSHQERVTYDPQQHPYDTSSNGEAPLALMLKDEELDSLKSEKDPSAIIQESQCVLVECIDEGRKNTYAGYEKMEVQGFVIAKRIRIMLENGILPHDIAVITRAKNILLYIARFLFEFNIPYTLEDSVVSLRKDVGRDFFSWVSVLLYPEDRGVYASVLRSPLCGISDNTVLALLHQQRHTNEHTVFCSEDIEDMPYKSVSEDIGALKSIRKKYLEARTYIAEGDLIKVLYHFWIDCGYRYVLLRNKKYYVFLSQFDVLKTLIMNMKEEGIIAFVDTLRSIIAGDNMNITLSQTHKDSGVQLMSIHKAKGLEFPYVILANMGADILRSAQVLTRCTEYEGNMYIDLGLPGNTHHLLRDYDAQKTPTVFSQTVQHAHAQDIAELLRMLYVAMTRAEKGLILTGFSPRNNSKDRSYLSWLMNRRLIPSDRDYAMKALVCILSHLGPGPFRWRYTDFLTTKYCMFVSYSQKKVSEEIAQYEKETQTTAMRSDTIQDMISTELTYAKVIAMPSDRVEYSPSGGRHLRPDFRENSLPTLAVDNILKKHHAYVTFGTYCHFLLHNYCSNREPGAMPVQLESQLLPFNAREQHTFISDATQLCRQFLQTPLWREKTHRAKVYTEHPFLMWSNKHAIWIRGIIDLLIVDGDTYTIIDYKVDSFQNPEKYHYQLAAYTLSVEKMYGLPSRSNKVRSYLYYLRSGQEVHCDVTSFTDEDVIVQYLKEKKNDDIEITDTPHDA